MVMEKRVLIVGAAGDVGQGVVQAAVDAGHKVIAAGRNGERLAALRTTHPTARLATVVGDIGAEDGAQALWAAASVPFGGVDVVVVSVNAPIVARSLFEWRANELGDLFKANVLTHFQAAQAFIPQLPEDGLYVGVGGGMADFIAPKMAQLSMMQAALRMMYRGLARERRGQGPAIRELMIVSMVNGQSKRDRAEPAWVTDLDVGRHVCAIIAAPQLFPGPVLELKSRAQAGQPDLVEAPPGETAKP
jgi:NAD(P)-dependent dehydrogenase (short-subunit alcohol dehydrogenase family)